MLTAVLGCLAALLLFAQAGGVLHELSHVPSDRHDTPGHFPAKPACDMCGALATLAAPLGMPPPPALIAQPDAQSFPIPTLPEPRVRGVTVHNRDPPLPPHLALTA